MAEICTAYWHPIYAYARRVGYTPEDAQDVTQGFFANLLEHPLFERADVAKGRFRSFLLTAFRNYLSKEREHLSATKRSGGHPHLSLNIEQVEARLGPELAVNQTPERLYERAWAVAMLDEAMRRLEAECAQSARTPLFKQIQPCLEGDCDSGHYQEIAKRLGTTPGTIQVTVSRMRHRYLEVLQVAIRQTVDTEAEAKEELRHLLEVVRT